ncbi:RNA polymerase sigma factor [Gabonibacter massiliensis]|uniref:RNA polymerase sigma factor n=1 Tax=Gabonibacter massiliensis TaxID=1720195 RepID=UPI0025709B97|nr:RNA polymerase sigma-70 factor [Gabonibacter massiliensis]
MIVKSKEDNIYIEGLKKRDPEAYEIVFKMYYKVLVLFVERHIGDRNTAKDLVQDIFLKLYENSSSFPNDFNLKSWLYCLARNAAIDYLRHLKVMDRNKFLMAEAMLYAADIDKCVDERLYAKIQSAIETLPDQCKRIVLMSVVEGKKYWEISNELGITMNTVRTQIARGYKKLREQLSNDNMAVFLLMGLFAIAKEKEIVRQN